mgnify:CR=1 FL=1
MAEPDHYVESFGCFGNKILISHSGAEMIISSAGSGREFDNYYGSYDLPKKLLNYKNAKEVNIQFSALKSGAHIDLVPLQQMTADIQGFPPVLESFEKSITIFLQGFEKIKSFRNSIDYLMLLLGFFLVGCGGSLVFVEGLHIKAGFFLLALGMITVAWAIMRMKFAANYLYCNLVRTELENIVKKHHRDFELSGFLLQKYKKGNRLVVARLSSVCQSLNKLDDEEEKTDDLEAALKRTETLAL